MLGRLKEGVMTAGLTTQVEERGALRGESEGKVAAERGVILLA